MGNILKKFEVTEIKKVVKSGENFIIDAEIPHKIRQLKFNIDSKGNIYGFSQDQWLELTEPTQDIIRSKVKQYCRQSVQFQSIADNLQQ